MQCQKRTGSGLKFSVKDTKYVSKVASLAIASLVKSQNSLK